MSTEGNAGSLEPIKAGEGKWWEELSAADIEHLKGLAVDIDKAVDLTVKQVARGKIKVGKLLLEARKCFPSTNSPHSDEGSGAERLAGDKAFGRWREMHTMVQSKQHAHYLMQVAEKFGDAPKLIEGANYSILQELVLADQKEIEWVEKEIDKGTPPTVAEVRKKVTAKKTRPKGASHRVVPIAAPRAELDAIVQMDLHVRISKVTEHKIKGLEGHLIILGLDSDPHCPCNPEVLEAIDDFWNGETTPEAYKIVQRSIQAVTEEFKNWDE